MADDKLKRGLLGGSAKRTPLETSNRGSVWLSSGGVCQEGLSLAPGWHETSQSAELAPGRPQVGEGQTC
ncbi:hypothetical protein VTN96DRAFT_2227 [Rasamsonia emersonii]